MDLAWIVVSDIAKAKKFFVEKLGLKLHADSPEHGWLELSGASGGAMLGVAKESKHTPLEAGNNAVIALTVDDIVATKKEFEKKGVKMLGDIMEVPGHVKLQLFVDDDGNYFQLAQNLDGHKKKK